MSRRFLRTRKAVRFALITGSVVIGTTLVTPKEALPHWWLPLRVLLEGVGRLFRCCSVGLLIMYDYKVNLIGKDEDQAAWDEVHLRSAHRLVALAEQNGGLYVKAGQGFALMNHMLPHQYCKTMAVLQDAVIKRPYTEVEAVLAEDLGKPPREIFAEFDEKPIAAATLEDIRKERRYEMAWEQYARQDNIRFGTFLNAVPGWRGVSDAKHLLFPIPKDAMDVNNKLVQNPGY